MFRSWYYFRLGYNTYLMFPIGYGSTLVTIYYLAIQNIPSLKDVFSKFVLFGVVATVAVVPLSVAIGWFHFKRSQAYQAEIQISYESHPYLYKLAPGTVREVDMPLHRELLLFIKDVLSKEGMLDPVRSKRFEELLQKIDSLLQGGYVGKPRVRI